MRMVRRFLLWRMLFFWFLFGILCIWRVSLLRTRLGSSGVPPAGHALWAEVGGGVTFVTSREKTFKSIKPVFSVLGFMWVC